MVRVIDAMLLECHPEEMVGDMEIIQTPQGHPSSVPPLIGVDILGNFLDKAPFFVNHSIGRLSVSGASPFTPYDGVTIEELMPELGIDETTQLAKPSTPLSPQAPIVPDDFKGVVPVDSRVDAPSASGDADSPPIADTSSDAPPPAEVTGAESITPNATATASGTTDAVHDISMEITGEGLSMNRIESIFDGAIELHHREADANHPTASHEESASERLDVAGGARDINLSMDTVTNVNGKQKRGRKRGGGK